LVDQRTRPPAQRQLAVVAVLCAVAMLAIGLYYAGDTGPRGFDASIKASLDTHLAGSGDLLTLLVLATQPYVLIPVILLVVVVCLVLRRRQDALLALLGPAVGISANTWVLKPLFDRQSIGVGLEGTLAYPSGHTVSLVTTLTVLTLLARPGLATAVISAMGAILLVAAAVGMIELGYHYFTDIVGGTFFAVAVVFALRILIGRLWPHPSREPSSG
jgi:membrane-associated phospholipid phosphatase